MTYTITANMAHHSNEVAFPGKPSAAVREALKAMHFRWHSVRRVWLRVRRSGRYPGRAECRRGRTANPSRSGRGQGEGDAPAAPWGQGGGSVFLLVGVRADQRGLFPGRGPRWGPVCESARGAPPDGQRGRYLRHVSRPSLQASGGRGDAAPCALLRICQGSGAGRPQAAIHRRRRQGHRVSGGRLRRRSPLPWGKAI